MKNEKAIFLALGRQIATVQPFDALHGGLEKPAIAVRNFVSRIDIVRGESVVNVFLLCREMMRFQPVDQFFDALLA